MSKNRKQSPKDKQRRLNEGRCPTHGLPMPQADGWFYPKNDDPYTVVGCPRKDCNIRAKAYDRNEPCILIDSHVNSFGEE